MSLEKYKSKRKFDDTPEPEGKVTPVKDKLIFVVQRHHASHLHYDFRLELDGVLKSWAVPKGPSLNPHDKRLAMMVEDHPKDYATFQGDIPEGNYGAGHVDVWDHGTYVPIDEDGEEITPKQFAQSIHAGNAKFRMKGRHLKGDFALVNMRKDEKTWLLLKHNDKYATQEEYSSEDYAKKSSLAYTAKRNEEKKVVKKKVRLIPEAEKKNKVAPARKVSGKKLDDYLKPMLATLHDKPFSDDDWIFEIKWDGYRAIADVNKKEKKLYSRNGLSFADAYPAVFAALDAIKKHAIIDGEIVALDDQGKPSFQLLQQYGQDQSAPICYYVFDCLYINGKSVEDKPLLQRKEMLRKLLPESDVIKYCDHVEKDGTDFFKALKKQGLEGMIAKRADSKYRENDRTIDWLKVKNVIMEEAVIAGYTEPRGSRKKFGALVLGLYKDDKLVYIGHTGTGFNDKTLKEVYALLQELKTDNSPFSTKVPVNSPVTWVEPRLVCNLKYSEITEGGHRRHPVFMGLRVDKAAEDVHEEVRDDK